VWPIIFIETVDRTGADVNAEVDGNTPIVAAATGVILHVLNCFSVMVLIFFLRTGRRSINGAAAGGHIKCLDMIIMAGADCHVEVDGLCSLS